MERKYDLFTCKFRSLRTTLRYYTVLVLVILFTLFVMLRLNNTINWNWLAIFSPLFLSLTVLFLRWKKTAWYHVAFFGLLLMSTALTAFNLSKITHHVPWVVVLLPLWLGILLIFIINCVVLRKKNLSPIKLFLDLEYQPKAIFLIFSIGCTVFSILLALKLDDYYPANWFHVMMPLWLSTAFFIEIFLCLLTGSVRTMKKRLGSGGIVAVVLSILLLGACSTVAEASLYFYLEGKHFSLLSIFIPAWITELLLFSWIHFFKARSIKRKFLWRFSDDGLDVDGFYRLLA